MSARRVDQRGNRRETAQKRRDRIISAAIELIARDGLDNVTLRAVAQHAGCWLGSVSHFFPERKQLVTEAVAESSRRCTRDMLESLSRGESSEARFRSFCRTVLESYVRGVPHFLVIDRANAGSLEDAFPRIIQQPFDEVHAALGPIVQDMAPEHAMPARWLISYVLSLAYGAGKLHRQHHLLLELGTRTATDRFIDGLVSFARAGLGSPLQDTLEDPSE